MTARLSPTANRVVVTWEGAADGFRARSHCVEEGRCSGVRCGYATEDLTAGELKKAKEGMRNYLKKTVTGGLAPYAHKAGAAKSAQWEFEDRTGR